MHRSPFSLGRVLPALVVSALVLLGCGAPGDHAEPDAGGELPPLASLRVGTVANLALSVPLVGLATDAPARGYAETVEFVPINSPDEIRANLTSGRVDVATMPTTVAVTLANGGIDVQLLGVVDADLLKVIGPAGSSGWEALRGKTVHVPFRGDFVDLVFSLLAEERGLVVGRDVTVVYGTALPELVSAIATDRARYAVIPEQFATLARQQADAAGHPTTQLLNLAAEWRQVTGSASLPGAAIVIRSELAAQRPELVAELRRHFAVTTAAVTGDPSSAVAELGNLARVPVELVPAVLAALGVRFLDPEQVRPDVEEMLRRLVELEPRSAGGRLPDAAFYGG